MMNEGPDVVVSETTGKLVAILGFFGVFVATLLAHLSPTQGYEISIYGSTPLAVWGLLFVSFTVATVLSFFAPAPLRRLGPPMGLLVMVVVASIPVIRGYVLFGQFDHLNHAGFVVEILKDGRILSKAMYPAMHMEAASLSLIAGISGYHALISLPGVFAGLFVLGGVMLVRSFDRSWWAESTGVLLLCLLLPIISLRLPKLQAIPAVFASFYCIFLLGLLTRLFQGHSSTIRRVTYLIIGPALVFYHPQFALVALGTGVLLILLLRTLGSWFPYEPYLVRRMFGFSALIGVVFWEWVSGLPGFRGAFVSVLVETSEGGGELPDPSGKLQEVGGSTPEIILKMFGVKIVVSVFAIGVGLYLLHRAWKTERPYSTPLYIITAAGLVTLPLIGLFFNFLAQVSQGFRYIGFGFGLTSIVAAVGIALLIKRTDTAVWPRVLVAVFLVVAAAAVGPTVYKSPYVYQPSAQVTEGQLVGYDFMFEHRGDGEITSIRSSPYRARNALYGKTISEDGIGRERNVDVVYQYGVQSFPAETEVPAHFSNRRFHVNNSNVYLVTTARGRGRYLDLYDGFKYNQSDFAYLDENSAVVYSNGDLRAHYFG